MTDANNIAVIAAVGEICHRPDTAAEGREPVVLVADAIRQADAALQGKLLPSIDSLELIGQVTWRYANPAALLCEKLGIAPAAVENASMGGDTPTRLVHQAALRIARGESRVSVIAGGEAISAKRKARTAGVELDWTSPCSPDEAVVVDEQGFPVHPDVARCGVLSPAHCYPLYEMAYQAGRGQSPEEGTAESARLWEQFAQVAQTNPYAWIRRAPDAKTIGSPGPDNRLIAYPYPKLMVANSVVNQAAAIVVCSLGWARAVGLKDHQLTYIHGGALAREPDDFLKRDQFSRSRAQDEVLDAAVRVAGGDSRAFDIVELYSCFPVVPKLALDRLPLRAGVKPSVTGGLTFFGGPMNSFMAHAVAAVFRQFRAGNAHLALLYANGGFLTKHHALVLSSSPPAGTLPENFSVQDRVDSHYGPVPEYVGTYTGPARIETCTVLYDRQGPSRGFVVLRAPEGQRTVASVRADDTASIACLTDPSHSPVGQSGQVSVDESGNAVWCWRDASETATIEQS